MGRSFENVLSLDKFPVASNTGRRVTYPLKGYEFVKRARRGIPLIRLVGEQGPARHCWIRKKGSSEWLHVFPRKCGSELLYWHISIKRNNAVNHYPHARIVAWALGLDSSFLPGTVSDYAKKNVLHHEQSVRVKCRGNWINMADDCGPFEIMERKDHTALHNSSR